MGASAADAAAIAELNSYGTLVQNPTTGAWSYTLDNGKAATQALGASFSKDFALTYTMKDGDGDEKSATLTITVKGANDGPAVTVDPGTPDGANDQVLELGLSTGSTAGTGHVAEGTFTLSDPDGLASLVSVTINGGTPILIADLVGSTIDGAHGTLEITAYDAATGVASYKYTLTSATTDVADVTEKDTFTLTVSDGTATSAEASIVIDIVDDEPNAVDDSGYTVIEDDAAANVVSGNVLDNDVHANGQPGADAPKAFVGWGASAADAAAIAELNSYGTLVQNPTTGAWSYTLDNGKAATQALGASFSKDFALTYTMKDGDGDEKSATLTITVKGANDGPAVTVDPGTPDGANDQVLELGLSTGSTAGTGHVAEGTFTLSDPDGLASLVSVTINGGHRS